MIFALQVTAPVSLTDEDKAIFKKLASRFSRCASTLYYPLITTYDNADSRDTE